LAAKERSAQKKSSAKHATPKKEKLAVVVEPIHVAQPAVPSVDIAITAIPAAILPHVIATAEQTTSQRKQGEDRALVRRARAGDERAFAELIQRHRHGIERLVRPLVRSAPTDEVEDLVQEALTKAFLHIHSYSEEYAFTTWLYRIATNHAIDYLRRRKLNAFSISAPPTQNTHKSDDDSREFEIKDESWVPDEMMVANERTKMIEDAIEQLPENYKRVIKLRHSQDLEYEEIAKVLQIPMGTVKVHLHRARAALARMLEGKI
jgi:RNA polymerase sigma factor (sigma-70 family)